MNNLFDFQKKKSLQEKISMITCYDFTSAKIIDQTDIDCVLVGDTLSMLVHGCPDTTGATLDMMAMHTLAVSRGIKTKFIIGDLPFMSYRKSLSETTHAIETLVRAGAHAIKLEGANGNLTTIQHAVASGIPMMGHLGLTPQHIHALGGFKVQGKNNAACNKLIEDAKSLEAAGCFALVLECIPADLAQEITSIVHIPTIGIGAGPHTDGQVLVLHDLLGLQTELKPKFVKRYFAGDTAFKESINAYALDVSLGLYPTLEHSY